MSDTIVAKERPAAEAEHRPVVFLIGMCIGRRRKLGRWLPAGRTMPAMLAELEREPVLGLFHSRPLHGLRNLGVLQDWRSAADLRAYAHDPTRTDLFAARRFNRLIGTGSDFGTGHETDVVPPGRLEAVDVAMPRSGLAGAVAPATRSRATAARRHRRPTPPPRLPRPSVRRDGRPRMTLSAAAADPARR